MRRSIRLSEFGRLSEPEKRVAVGELAKAAHGPPNGELRALEDEIRSFERRYELSSAQMREMVASGRLPENQDVCRWLMSLEVLGLIAGGEART